MGSIDPTTRIGADGRRRPMAELTDEDEPSVSKSALASVTAPAVDSVQTITRTATGGTVDVTFGGETAEGISIVAATTSANLKTALVNGLDSLETADLTIAGSAGGPFTVTFAGQYAGMEAPWLIVDDADATGGTVLAEVTVPGNGPLDGDEALAVMIADHEARLDELEP
jgi:hypothetical protein